MEDRMNVFVGEIAAYAMLILIWTLLLKFLQETGWIKVEKECFVSSYLVIAIGFGYLLMGGFIYNLLGGQASVLKYDTVWGFGEYAIYLQNCEEGSVDGLFSTLYLLLARGIGTIFFKEYVVCTIYTSFLLMLLTGLVLQGICRKCFDECWWRRVWFLFFLIPGVYRMFLPSEKSLICFIVVGVLWILIRFFQVRCHHLKEGFYSRMVYAGLVISLSGLQAAICFEQLIKRG